MSEPFRLRVPSRALRVAAAVVLGAIVLTGPAQMSAAAEATNPGFESGLTGWGPGPGATATVTQDPVHGGVNAVALSRARTAGPAALTDAPDQFTQIPADTICTASAWVRGPVGYKATVKWTARSATTTVATRSRALSFDGGWQQLPAAVLAMPAEASTADLQFSAPAFPVGQTWHLDDVAADCDVDTDPEPPGGLVAHWRLDEVGASIAVDSSGNGNDGVNSNVVGDGEAYTFNGVDARVVVGDSPTLDPGLSDFSYGVTLRMDTPPAVGETYDVLRKGLSTTAGGEYKLEIVHSNGKALARCVVKDAQKVTPAIRGTTNLADGNPHTVACSRVGNSVTLQVDDKVHTRTVTSLGSVSNGTGLGLGAKAEQTVSSGYDWYLGEISDAWLRIG